MMFKILYTSCAPSDVCSIEVLDFDITNPEIVAKIWQGQGARVDALLGCRKPTSIWNDTTPGMCFADNSYSSKSCKADVV